MNTSAEFYDPIAADYDQVFVFKNRLNRAREFIRKLNSRLGNIETAIDTACGTGAYTLALAETGIQTTGLDISAAMIKQARAHSKQLNIQTEWMVQSMTDPLPGATYNLLLCMGNSLPHLTTGDELEKALINFRYTLQHEGVAVFQLLNYEKIIKNRERIVGVTRDPAGRVFVRFYDFPENRTIIFNILTIDWNYKEGTQAPSTSLQSTELYPYTERELKKGLSSAGFEKIESFTGLDFAPFCAKESDTLLQVARI